MKSDIEKRKILQPTAIHKQMKMDDTIIDSDILESELKELWAKCYFESWNLPRIRFLFKKLEISLSDENQQKKNQ